MLSNPDDPKSKSNMRRRTNPRQYDIVSPHLTLRTTALTYQNRSRRGLSPNSWANGTSAPVSEWKWSSNVLKNLKLFNNVKVWDRPTESTLTNKAPCLNGCFADEGCNDFDRNTGRNALTNFGRHHRSVSSFELRNRCPVHGVVDRPSLRRDVRRQAGKKQVRYQDESMPMVYVPPPDETDSDEPTIYVRAQKARNM